MRAAGDARRVLPGGTGPGPEGAFAGAGEVNLLGGLKQPGGFLQSHTHTCPTAKPSTEVLTPLMFTASLSVTAKSWKQPRAPQEVPGSGGTLLSSKEESWTHTASAPHKHAGHKWPSA